MIHTILEKQLAEFEEVFQKIGVNRSEFQVLWAYGNPIKRIIHDTINSFLRSFYFAIIEGVGEEVIGKDDDEPFNGIGTQNAYAIRKISRNELRKEQRALLANRKTVKEEI